MKFYWSACQLVLIVTIFLLFSPLTTYAKHNTLSLKVVINDSPDKSQTISDPEIDPTPIPEASPITTPVPTIVPSPTPTPAPVSTPEPVQSSPAPVGSPIPTQPPVAGAPITEKPPEPTPAPVVTQASIPVVIEKIQKQINNNSTPIKKSQPKNLTPGQVIAPIIPRTVYERMIPPGLYKKDGLDPVDGFALLTFGIGFIFAGIALLRPDIFLPALSGFESFSGHKLLIMRQFLRRNNQPFMHHNG